MIYNGIINVYKEPGFTSFDVIAKLRGILHMKKIGHTGTLDPDAEGVLPVVLGNATKLAEELTDKTKTYECLMRLGVETDTEDMGGMILKESPVECRNEEVEKAVLSFTGDYDQVPPMYSAIKKDGKRLYELARKGEVMDLPARKVKINEIRIESIDLPLVTMTIDCGRGTYIRSLCRDIGKTLGCGAAMQHLKRTRSGPFFASDAHTLSEIESYARAGRAGELIAGTDSCFPDIPSAKVKSGSERFLFNGNILSKEDLEYTEDSSVFKGRIKVYDASGEFKALYVYDGGRKAFKPLKMFL